MSIVWDVVALVGFGMVLGGLAWVHPGLSLAACGAGLMVYGILGAKAWESSQRFGEGKRR